MRRKEKVVILCGGKGTRSYPYTQYFPKVMMPIQGKPILVHLMRTFASQGFDEFVLSASYRKEVLSDYFEGRSFEWKVDIVDTGDDADTGDRIIRCADYVGDRFLATYGDGLSDIDLEALIDFHTSHGSYATLTTVPLHSQYGLVRFDRNGMVTCFEEKPTIRASWINGGFFVFDRRAFDCWNGHNLEKHVLPALARNRQLYAYHHDGFWKSMDTSKDQEELESLLTNGSAPWERIRAKVRSATQGD